MKRITFVGHLIRCQRGLRLVVCRLSLRRPLFFLSLLLTGLLALGLAHFTGTNKTFEADFSRERLDRSARIEQITFELGL